MSFYSAPSVLLHRNKNYLLSTLQNHQKKQQQYFHLVWYKVHIILNYTFFFCTKAQ